LTNYPKNDFVRQKEKEAKETVFGLLREGKAPLSLRLAVARGELPLTTLDFLQMLFLLRDDPDKEVQSSLRATIEAIEGGELAELIQRTNLSSDQLDFLSRYSLFKPEVLETIVLDSATSDKTMEFLAAKIGPKELELILADQLRLRQHPSILERIKHNPLLSAEEKRRLLQMGQASLQSQAIKDKKEEERLTVLQKIARLTAGQKTILALKGTREERVVLVRDPNRRVATMVLKSPKLGNQEVESISNMRNVCEEVLRGIAESREWKRKYPIVHSLVKNPKTPVGVAVDLVYKLNNIDLNKLKNNLDISEAVRKKASRTLKSRIYVDYQSRGRAR